MGKEKNHKKKKKISKKNRRSSAESDEYASKRSSVELSSQNQTNQSSKREEWMSLNSLLKTQTRDQWKLEKGTSRTLNKLEERLKKEKANEPGSHSRELNQYYKNGGTGLPSSVSEQKTSSSSSFYDAAWLKKALERAKNQAAQESRSLEEVAAERWGSLETFYKLLEEAENKGGSERGLKEVDRDHNQSWRRRSEHRSHRSRSRERNRNSYKRESSSSRSRSSKSKKRKKKKKRIKSDSSSSDSSSDSSSTSERSSSSRSSERRYKKSSHSERRDKIQMLKPGSDDETLPERSSVSSWRKADNHSSRGGNGRSWRKELKKPPERVQDSHRDSSISSTTIPTKDIREAKQISLKEIKESESISVEKDYKVDRLSNSTQCLSDKEMNKLGAKITKAELMGNEELVAKLKAKLDAARTARASKSEDPTEEEQVVILTRTDRTGFTRPVSASKDGERQSNPKGNKKNKAQMYGSDGKRTSYFADDSRVDLQSMFEKEKCTKVADEISELKSLATCGMEKLSEDFDVDDLFISKVASRESGEKDAIRDKQRAIWEHQKTQKILESCNFCFGNKSMKKHLIVALGDKCYLSVPPHASVAEGQCLIAPNQHVLCGTQADEDLWEEITNFRQALVRMFWSQDQDCVFFETVTGLARTPHMVVHCIPMPKETGELAPIYFKKAILECEEEWSVNKKLIDLKGRSMRRAVPKGLPYFWVDFGLTPGFAHVVEDERVFPKNFAQEIVGGMLEADHTLFRRPKMENFEVQNKKVMKFISDFKPFDPTSK